MKSPLNNEVSAALAQFFFAGTGPSHSALTRTFTSAGFAASDPYDAETQTPNKQQRVLAVCHAAQGRTVSMIGDKGSPSSMVQAEVPDEWTDSDHIDRSTTTIPIVPTESASTEHPNSTDQGKAPHDR